MFLGLLPPFANLAYFSLALDAIFLVVLYLVHSYGSWGWKLATKYAVVATVISYLLEFVGVTTGVPFGRYTYSNALGYFLGPVPIFIPFFWAALGYFCLAASGRYLAGAALMVLLDLSFDPVFSLSLWHWVGGGAYFGVPLTNFFGWFVTSALFFAVFYLVSRRRPIPSSSSSTPAIAFYLLFGVSNAFLDASSGLIEVALISASLFASASFLLYWKGRDR